MMHRHSRPAREQRGAAESDRMLLRTGEVDPARTIVLGDSAQGPTRGDAACAVVRPMSRAGPAWLSSRTLCCASRTGAGEPLPDAARLKEQLDEADRDYYGSGVSKLRSGP